MKLRADLLIGKFMENIWMCMKEVKKVAENIKTKCNIQLILLLYLFSIILRNHLEVEIRLNRIFINI